MKSFVALLSLLVYVGAAAQPTTAPSEGSSGEVERTGDELLRKPIERERREIATLNGQVDALVAQLRGLGLQPVVGSTADVAPATQPAVRRIIFVRFGYSNRFINDQIVAAVKDLKPDQYFNVVGC